MSYKGYFIEAVPSPFGFTPVIIDAEGNVSTTADHPTAAEALESAKRAVDFMTGTENIEDVMRVADQITDFGRNDPEGDATS
ncbi:MAG: hypothetical protein MOGMAGMI_02544 [Candidatus Omnitrophica bacterium]|nr:hypothetical protein [Candidatus Omnitrophota bacterium]